MPVKPNLTFLSPQYWPIWLAYWLMFTLVYLPHPVLIVLGRGLGLAAYYLASKRRHIVKTNIRLCFNDLSVAQQATLVKKVFYSGGITMLETASAWIRGASGMKGRATLHGLENLQAAQVQGRGVILLGMHLSTLDITGAVLSSVIPFDVIYRSHANPLLEHIMTSGRANYHPHVIERNDVRTVIRNLKQGHIVWYAPDQDYGAHNAVFTPFFGVPAATLTAISKIAKITGAVVICLHHFRSQHDSHYDIYLSPPWTNFPSASETSDVAKINQFVEEIVKLAPAQYWWFHRRFKTRPKGEPEVY